ncbi:hypothetical protein K435DRAFT_132914 [Dendrothele bispora CBS 962.96]|uniref:DRBM domain-containing protein n=1 Tax=Dendrothele bispora (strain CBS 962.96) TaxID=1314807 RepID=A0A4S8KMP7_DENBC|nr:hypothetical protein K435DRAFT_132914 [Dendrothele bispora CBS 962.96]
MVPRYARQLINLLQVINDGDTSPCSYREWSSGPPYAPFWDVTAFINGRQYGKGSSSAKNEAKENASRMALQRLQGEVQNLITSAGGINLGTGTAPPMIQSHKLLLKLTLTTRMVTMLIYSTLMRFTKLLTLVDPGDSMWNKRTRGSMVILRTPMMPLMSTSTWIFIELMWRHPVMHLDKMAAEDIR